MSDSIVTMYEDLDDKRSVHVGMVDETHAYLRFRNTDNTPAELQLTLNKDAAMSLYMMLGELHLRGWKSFPESMVTTNE